MSSATKIEVITPSIEVVKIANNADFQRERAQAIAAAHFYTRKLNIYVTPCANKRARVRYVNGEPHELATNDPAGAAEQFASLRGISQLGIVTGKASGVFGIEADLKDGGAESMALLFEKFGPFPPTWESRSGSGGPHWFFKHPRFKVHSSAGDLAEGVDVRGHNGILIEYPSIHSNGNRYRWLPGRSPFELPPAIAPKWLLDWLRGRSRSLIGRGAKHRGGGKHSNGFLDLDLIEVGVPQGQRDDQLFRYASNLRQENRPREEAEQLVLAAAKRCKPPFPDDQALMKVEQAWKFAPGRTNHSTIQWDYLPDNDGEEGQW